MLIPCSGNYLPSFVSFQAFGGSDIIIIIIIICTIFKQNSGIAFCTGGSKQGLKMRIFPWMWDEPGLQWRSVLNEHVLVVVVIEAKPFFCPQLELRKSCRLPGYLFSRSLPVCVLLSTMSATWHTFTPLRRHRRALSRVVATRWGRQTPSLRFPIHNWGRLPRRWKQRRVRPLVCHGNDGPHWLVTMFSQPLRNVRIWAFGHDYKWNQWRLGMIIHIQKFKALICCAEAFFLYKITATLLNICVLNCLNCLFKYSNKYLQINSWASDTFSDKMMRVWGPLSS